MPLFSGNFNFISSDISNYWHFHVRFPKTSHFFIWPSLIYSDDISIISKKAEEVILANKALFCDTGKINNDLFFEKVNDGLNIAFQPLAAPLRPPDMHLPYYEGLTGILISIGWGSTAVTKHLTSIF